jgi:hypothetical protein
VLLSQNTCRKGIPIDGASKSVLPGNTLLATRQTSIFL